MIINIQINTANDAFQRSPVEEFQKIVKDIQERLDRVANLAGSEIKLSDSNGSCVGRAWTSKTENGND